MNLQEFKQIFSEYGGGFVSPEQINELAEFAPDLPLGVKVGYGSRFATTAKHFKLDLENNTKYHLDVHNVEQYVRDVFVPCSTYDEVRQIFGWANKE
jgi:hypothetical protein